MANDSLMTPLEKAVWEFLRAIRRAGELGEAKDHHRLNLKHPILAVSDRVWRDTVFGAGQSLYEGDLHDLGAWILHRPDSV